jgi:hypothetical protein
MEQLPDVCLRRRGLGKSELSGMAAQDNAFRLAVPLIRNPRMSGAPSIDRTFTNLNSFEKLGNVPSVPRVSPPVFAKPVTGNVLRFPNLPNA